MNTLNLTLKKKWFEMIACGEKKEEYREIKDYWKNRLGMKFVLNGLYVERISFKEFNQVFAKNGYSKTSPIIHWEHLGITIGEPNPSWCEPQDVGKKVFILKIGDILYRG